MIDYNGMSVNNKSDYLKIRRIMAEPEIELGQEFDGGFFEEPESVEDQVEAMGAVESINSMLEESLAPREAEVIKYRFALDGHEELTLKAVGNIFNVSPERLRQIEWKALRKLRHPSRSEKLKEFMVACYG